MPWIEGVVADHIERGKRKVLLQHLVKVLVVRPGEMHAIQAAAFAVYTERGLVLRDCAIWIVREELVVDNLVGEPAADRKCVADNGPLRLPEQAEHLADVVHKPGEHEPVWMAVGADRF